MPRILLPISSLTHLVLRVAPRPVSSAPVGFVHDNGTDFMSQYLVPPASLPDTMPSLLLPLGGIPIGPRSVPLAGCSLRASSILYGTGGASCIPVGSALCPLVPQDTPYIGPCCLDPEEGISTRLHIVLKPSFCLWGASWLCIPPDSGRNPSEESAKMGPAGMEWGI